MPKIASHPVNTLRWQIFILPIWTLDNQFIKFFWRKSLFVLRVNNLKWCKSRCNSEMFFIGDWDSHHCWRSIASLCLLGSVLPPGEVMSHLKYILEDTRPPQEYPVGAFTSEYRNVWAKYRNKLLDAGKQRTMNYGFNHLFYHLYIKECGSCQCFEQFDSRACFGCCQATQRLLKW